MADRAKKVSKNLQQAPQKSALSGKAEAKKHARHVNIVHRTTSESLRLETAAAGGAGGESSADGSSGSGGKQPPAAGTSSVSMLNAAAAAAAARKPKTSSFQITSVVTKGGPRISSSSGGAADNGEDSADDLDESHAEDSSRVTDIDTETPSFSEDTFSKEDVFFTSSDAIGSAPVIPTSSQYGLAIVAPNMPGAQNLADVHVSVTDAGINLMTNSKKDVDLKDIHHRNERFKVVKIESTEPFRRGRWICMDYLDHSTLQPTIEEGEAGEVVEGEEPPSAGVEEEAVSITAGEETASVAASGPSMPANESPGQTLQQPLANEINNSSSSNNNNGSSNSSSRNQTSHAQTMAHIPTPQTQAAAGTTPPVTQTTNPNPVQTASPVTAAATSAQSQSTPVQAQSQPAPYYAQFTEIVHGATLPAALQPAVATTNSQQNTQAPVAAGVASTNALPQQLSVNVDASPQQETASTFSPQQQAATGISQSQTTSQSSPSIASPNSQPIEPPPPVQPVITTVPNGPIDGPVPEDTAGGTQSILNITTTINPQTAAAITAPDAAPAQPSPTSDFVAVTTSTTDHPVVTIPTAGDTITASMASLMSPSTIAIATAAIASGQSVSGLLPQSQQQLLNIVADDGTSNEDSESNLNSVASNPVARSGRRSSRYMTHPLSVPLLDPLAPNCTLPSCNSSIYTDIALGSCIENLMQPKNQQPIPCHHKSVQNLIREERSGSAGVGGSVGNIGIPIPRVQYKGSVEDLRIYAGPTNSGRSSPSLISTSMPNSPPRHLSAHDRSSRAASPLPLVVTENSASGTSAVAIDNKIEQAMDLVKSHLMFAVREEVEVLKEKIAELMDRINQLEVENTILKANATQETLSQLTATVPPKVPPTNPTNGPIS